MLFFNGLTGLIINILFNSNNIMPKKQVIDDFYSSLGIAKVKTKDKEMENLETEEKDYYAILKRILNKRYILSEKSELIEFHLECIKQYIKTLEKIKSLQLYLEQVKHLSNNRTIEKLERLEILRYKRDNYFNDLLDYNIIDLA